MRAFEASLRDICPLLGEMGWPGRDGQLKSLLEVVSSHGRCTWAEAKVVAEHSREFETSSRRRADVMQQADITGTTRMMGTLEPPREEVFVVRLCRGRLEKVDLVAGVEQASTMRTTIMEGTLEPARGLQCAIVGED